MDDGKTMNNPWISYDSKKHIFMVTNRNGGRSTLHDWLKGYLE